MYPSEARVIYTLALIVGCWQADGWHPMAYCSQPQSCLGTVYYTLCLKKHTDFQTV